MPTVVCDSFQQHEQQARSTGQLREYNHFGILRFPEGTASAVEAEIEQPLEAADYKEIKMICERKLRCRIVVPEATNRVKLFEMLLILQLVRVHNFTLYNESSTTPKTF